MKDGTVIAAGDSNRNRECQIQLTAAELNRLLKELDEVDHCFDLTPGGDHVIRPGQPYNQWDHGVDWLRIRRGTKEVHVGLVGGWIVGQEEHIPGVSTCQEILARLNPLIQVTRAGGWDEIERLLPIANAALKESFPDLPTLTAKNFSSSERFQYPGRSINFRRTGADGENFGVELEQRDDGTVNPISVWNGGDIRDVEKPLVVRGLDLSKIPFTKEWKEMEKLRVLTDSGYTFKPEYTAYEAAPEVWVCYLPGEDKFYIEVGNNQRRRKLYGPIAGNPLHVLNPPPVPAEADQETATTNRQRDLSLADLVRVFNNQSRPERQRLNQPELTEEEVSAVIRRDKWLREDPPLNEEEIKAFQAIAVSKRLPEYSHFNLETEDKTETVVWKKLWRVRLMLPAIGRDGHVGLTIRDHQVAEEKIEPRHVAWGTPDAEGLTLGIYLSPRKAQYAIGDLVRLRFLVRNSGSQPVKTMWPGISVPMPDDFTVTDETGAKVAVAIGHQNWDSPFTTFSRRGMLGVGDVHGLTVPYEIRIGGDSSADRLIGRVLDVRPGQTLQLKVREQNGSSRERPPGESEPESGSITFTIAAPLQNPAATRPGSVDETPTKGDEKAAPPQPDKNAKPGDPRLAQDEVRNLLKPALLLPDHWILQAVAFDRNGCEVITASNQSFITIRRWDLAGRSLISEVKLQGDRHGRPVRSGTLKFSGDLKRVIAATDAYVGIWDAVTGQLLKQLPFEAKSGIYDCAIDLLDCTPDLSVIVGHRALPGRLTLSYDAHLIVWDGNTGNVVRTIIDKGATDLKAIDLSTDGERLITTNGSGARIWDTRTGDLLRSIPNDNSDRKHSEPDVSSQYTSHVWSVQFSPDGRQVALGDILGVKLFDTQSGKPLQQLEGPYRYSSSASPGLVFSPDGEQLARLGTQEKLDGDKHRYVVPIWSTRTGAKQVVLHTEANDAAFSDDGQCFAVGFSDMQQALGVYLLTADEEDARESAGPGPHSRVDRVEENGHYVGPKAAEFIEQFQPTWGEARLGLQYGIALTKPGRRYRLGERVPLVVFFRNTSDQPIKFDTAPDFFGNLPQVLNSQGERLTLENIPLLGNIPHYHETLAPGEALGPFYLSIGLGENPRPSLQHWHPILKTPRAGTYTLTHSAMINVPGPKEEEGAKNEAAKKEKITSSPITFEIVE
ncbi:MAG: hypothetical protein NT069_22980 [Planctomycetota bacterium]|nr:hypothetical protein [Planctomycetota bacterium]